MVVLRVCNALVHYTKRTTTEKSNEYLTEYHGLSDRNRSVDVGEGLILFLETLALDVVLLDVVQTLLFALESDEHRVLNHFRREAHHLLLVRRREEQHLALGPQASEEKQKYAIGNNLNGGSLYEIINSPLNADRLVLVTLNPDHDVSFVENEHFDLLHVKCLELHRPVEHGARCSDHDLRAHLLAPDH